MKIKNWNKRRHLPVTFKDYINKVTGESDPMFVHSVRGGKGTSFVHASSLLSGKYDTLILDDGTEIGVDEYCNKQDKKFKEEKKEID